MASLVLAFQLSPCVLCADRLWCNYRNDPRTPEPFPHSDSSHNGSDGVCLQPGSVPYRKRTSNPRAGFGPYPFSFTDAIPCTHCSTGTFSYGHAIADARD